MAFYKCGRIYTTSNSRVDIDTKSGSVARFNTSLAMPVLGCNAEFSASQASGTPTPSAPIPIVGVDKVNVTRTGKNLVDIANKSNITIQTTLGIVVLKAGTYALSANVKNNGSISCYLTLRKGSTTKASITINANEDTRKSTSFTLTETDTYTVVCSGSSAGYDFDVSDLQIEFGETATTYEAPTVVTALINLGGTYYGGSVDAVTGKITLTHEILVYDGTENGWNKSSTYNGSFYLNTGKRHLNKNAKCSHAEFVSSLGSYAFGKFALDGNGYVNLNAFVQGTGVDLPTFKAWLATEYANGTPLTATLELETPIVVYASNTAEILTKAGLNNIFCDTGDIEVKYRKLHSDN